MSESVQRRIFLLVLAYVAVFNIEYICALSSIAKTRRNFFKAVTASATATAGIATTIPVTPASALDIEAFTNKAIEQDAEKPMTDDERTCKFAAPSQQKGEACERAGMKTTTGKKGGVDAFGNIDRGSYVRCMTSYPMIDGKYVKTVTCN